MCNIFSKVNRGRLPKKVYYVYIIKCRDKSLYTGITTDITRRIKEHNAKKGGAYTRTRLPVKLLYKEAHPSKSRALIREHEIKSWTRKDKLALIGSRVQKKEKLAWAL